MSDSPEFPPPPFWQLSLAVSLLNGLILVVISFTNACEMHFVFL